MVQTLTEQSQSTDLDCPGCRKSLRVARHRGVEIDWCEACQGIYLDRGELDMAMRLSSSRLRPLPHSSPVTEVVFEIGGWIILDLLFQAIGVIVSTIADFVDAD